MSEPVSSAACPICGVDTPHVHNLTEQGQYTKIQRLNAELSATQAREADLVEALKFYADGCHFIQHQDVWESVKGE